MTVRVRVFANPSLARSVVDTEVFHVADRINTTPAGVLEVIEDQEGKPFVRQAFAHGVWVDAKVERDNLPRY